MAKEKPKTVLVVEDEKNLAQIIKKQLEKHGYFVINKTKVYDALDALNENKIDCIWLDHYLLGEGDGLDLVYKLKNDHADWKKIPVYVVSNSASEDKQKVYLNLGVNKYYTKAEHSLDEIVTEIDHTLA